MILLLDSATKRVIAANDKNVFDVLAGQEVVEVPGITLTEAEGGSFFPAHPNFCAYNPTTGGCELHQPTIDAQRRRLKAHVQDRIAVRKSRKKDLEPGDVERRDELDSQIAFLQGEKAKLDASPTNLPPYVPMSPPGA